MPTVPDDMNGGEDSASCVARLLAGVSDAPSFPFEDWGSVPSSLAAITTFWNDLFRSAAGAKADDYRDTGDVTMDGCSFAFDVRTSDHSRLIRGSTWPQGGDACVIWYDATAHYRPDLIDFGERPDRVELCLVSDMQAARLVAVFEMIRVFTSAGIRSREACEELQARFDRDWGHLMVDPANEADLDA